MQLANQQARVHLVCKVREMSLLITHTLLSGSGTLTGDNRCVRRRCGFDKSCGAPPCVGGRGEVSWPPGLLRKKLRCYTLQSRGLPCSSRWSFSSAADVSVQRVLMSGAERRGFGGFCSEQSSTYADARSDAGQSWTRHAHDALSQALRAFPWKVAYPDVPCIYIFCGV